MIRREDCVWRCYSAFLTILQWIRMWEEWWIHRDQVSHPTGVCTVVTPIHIEVEHTGGLTQEPPLYTPQRFLEHSFILRMPNGRNSEAIKVLA